METIKQESIYELVQREWKLLLTLFITGILFYIYPICHQAITTDNELHIANSTFETYLTAKRWGITFLQKIFFLRTFVPGFWIIINMAMLSLASLFACEIFHFRQNWLKYLFGLLIISFPQYANMMKYALTADVVGVGFVVVTLALLLFSRSSSWKTNLGVSVLFILTFSIYQALIFIPLTLFLPMSAISLSKGEITIKEWGEQILRLGFLVIVSYIIYHLISKGLLIYFNLPTQTLSYFKEMVRWGQEPNKTVIQRVIRFIWEHWTGQGTPSMSSYVGETIFPLIWIPFFVLIWSILRQKTRASIKIFSILLLVLAMVAPFTQIILLGAYNKCRHSHVFLAQAFIFAPLMCLMFAYLRKIKPEWVMTGMFILFIHNGYRVTQNFHFDTILETAEKNYMARIMSRIDSMGIDLEKHRILLVGRKEVGPIFPDNKWSYRMGVSTMSFCNSYLRSAFILQDQGFTRTKLDYPSQVQLNNLAPIIASMPNWPAHESVRLVDDVVIIKLSDQYDLSKNYPSGFLSKF